MKKILTILLLIILFLNVSVLGFTPSDKIEKNTLSKSYTFLEKPKIEQMDEYFKILYNGSNSDLIVHGEPDLPIYVETFILPKDARNIKVKLFVKEIGRMNISGQVMPCFVYPMDLETPNNLELEKDARTYSSCELYPGSWWSFDIGRGLNGIDHVTYVKIILNLVRYSPVLNNLEYLRKADITLTYDYSDTISSEPDIYDMVIISPEKFVDEFQPLIDHKNDYGIKTTLKTVEDILLEYDGFDAPEKIKYFIKDAIENWGISYVLLGGGLRSHLFADDRDDCNQGTKDWYVPVRYTNIIIGTGRWVWYNDIDHGCISDLYYADIYDGEGNFSSWDSNGNGVFAEWSGDLIDDLDLYPDVYVARLPCRNEFEVKLIVNKIIVYESTNPSSNPWFTKMITIAGCTFRTYMGQPDGEYVCDVCLDLMCENIKKPVRVYASNNKTGGLTPVPNDIIEAFNGGASYVFFEGHGSPYSWNTHWSENENWTGGFNIFKFWRLTNGNKLPIVVVGGCHCGMYNVTIEKTILSGFLRIQYRLYILKEYDLRLNFLERILDRLLVPYDTYRTYGIPAPYCYSWGLCLVPWGGAIASTGLTGYGLSNYPISLSSELDLNIFYEIGQNNVKNIGQAHSGSITKYLNENYVDKCASHCITVFQLFGDPSLKIGGYQ